ncbi:hypothetical protein PIB30_058948 [Stylosanthes scabra]|uniref:Uncharacterized protein n=1 Tax=Stylosanthes scabra TaxID=79078 RepID=A0ABU6ZIS9_9FABA|nr:hypothetical protein [Stylosanthes scabra]
MFRHTRVNTLRELKQLILSRLGVEGDREIGAKEGYGRYVYGALCEVHQDGGSSGFCPFVSPVGPAPIHVVAPDDLAIANYNSGEDSDYEEESSCDSMEEHEAVLNTPTVGGPRLVLPAPLSSLILQGY